MTKRSVGWLNVTRALACGGVVTACAAMTGAAFAQGGPALVAVERIAQREISEGQTFVGTTIPFKKATVGSAVSGRVVTVFVDIGDRVENKGSLAQIMTETISLEWESAKAELQLRKQELAELQNGSLPEEIEQARAAMDASKARSEYMTARQNRILQLQGTRTITAEEMEEVNASLQEATAAYREAKATFDLAQQGPRQERIAQAQARVAIQEALAQKLEDQIKKHTVISRFDGYVVAKHTEDGAWVNQGDPVAEVAALDVIDVQAHVLENYIPYVRLGQTARVEISALTDSLFVGEVVAIDPEADPRSRTFEVKIRVQNELDGEVPRIKAGMIARVALPVGPRVDATLVPKDAITLGGPQPVVWTVDPATVKTVDQNGVAFREGAATAVPVRLGASDGDWIQALGQVTPGHWVVSKGNERIFGPPGAPAPVRWSVSSEPQAEAAAPASETTTPTSVPASTR